MFDIIIIFFRTAADFQQSVNSLGFMSGCLRHSLCRSSGRCCQQNLHSLIFKIMDDRSYGCRLSSTRTAADQQYSAIYRFHYRPFLQFIQLNPGILLYLIDFFLNLFLLVIFSDIQLS